MVDENGRNMQGQPAGASLPPPPSEIPRVSSYPSAPPAGPARIPAQGTPATPPNAPATGTDSPPRRRGWWAFLTILVATALLGTGLVIGQAIGGDGFLDVLDSVADSEGQNVKTAGSAPAASPDSALPVPDPLVDENDPEPIAAVAEIVSPSVVSIEIRQQDIPVAQGSGIVWAPGLIVTNAHVVQGTEEVVVRFANGLEAEGDVVGADPARDIALVSIDDSIEVQPAAFAPISTVEVGQVAVAVGSPFSLDQTVTSGIVSAVARAVPSQDEVIVEMIQTDASINPGNSGGALADLEGRVVGMNTSIRTDGVSQGNVGVGFAVPSDTISLIVDRLVNGESLETGYLGVYGESAVAGQGGVVVTDLVPGAAADEAGFRVGDLIVGLEGREVGSMGSLAAEVQLRQPGEVLQFSIVRDGDSLTVSVTLDSLG